MGVYLLINTLHVDVEGVLYTYWCSLFVFFIPNSLQLFKYGAMLRKNQHHEKDRTRPKVLQKRSLGDLLLKRFSRDI
jgi:hypothetical protein